MSKLFKRTKILATVGPSVDSKEKITELIMAGANGCRFNCSHGDDEERSRQLKWVREAAKLKGRSVATVLDLPGPKIRLGALKNNHLDVKTGDKLTLDYKLKEHSGGKILPVKYNLAQKVEVGQPVFLADGTIQAKIIEIPSDTAIKIEIENDGALMSNKGLNLPDTDFAGDILTEKDLAEIDYGVKEDFDYVAMSFVQSADDVKNLRKILKEKDSDAKIIAKIETKQAISSDAQLRDIVKAVDGIMVARGDMAVEAGAEVVPIVQRKLVALCREHSKLCIVATQMMNSMINNPAPTRAEVSDVASAVIQGADAVMLSDETANGEYPIETVKEMKRVILYTQNHSRVSPIAHEPVGKYHNYDAIASAAVGLAEQIEADALICQTATGETARAVAAGRPNLPIITVTSNPRIANQLALYYANSAFIRPFTEDYGVTLAQELKDSGYLQLKEGHEEIVAVIISGGKNRKGGTDTIQIRYI
ncbi:pyruvate kinase [Candidatus Saccharibacteria bacterium]|nr:pyruvate kinase [Candidatus Saccharibacteria bacterium]